eukprot:TRINITY_DN60278_c0_g1_i1.p1 TRINITY_DN60278_c0_g1~~TRINITY_DN60278_c0_g1_i1.p1  ORF type:complete len:552 (+),score=-12.12 TRINITY_DN60278_c0_g1_i1:3-1658(+)
MIGRAMARLLPTWELFEVGVATHDCSVRVSHAWWADNLYLFAKNQEEFLFMQRGLKLLLLDEYCWKWKPDSLDIMFINEANTEATFSCCIDNCSLVVQCRDHISILGTIVSSDACSQTALGFRIRQAEKAFWKYQRHFLARAPMASKLEAWALIPQSVAAYASSSYRPSRALLNAARSWEHSLFRRMFRLRRRPDEHHFVYVIRTSRRIDQWLNTFGKPSFHHIILRNIFRNAHKQYQADSDLWKVLTSRTRQWWLGVASLSSSQRAAHNCCRAKPGQAVFYDDPFLETLGDSWLNTLADSKGLAGWKKHERYFIDGICAKYNLPPLPPSRPKMNRDKLPVFFHVNEKRAFAVSNIPWPPACSTDAEWLPPHPHCPPLSRAFEFVSDNSALVDAVLARARPPECKEYLSIIEGVQADLEFVYRSGFSSRMIACDPIRWVPRRLNTAADYVCAWCKHIGSDINSLEPSSIAACIRRGCHIQFHSDGSFTGMNQVGTTGVTCIAWQLRGDAWHQYAVGFAGTHTDVAKSAFHMEAAALHLASSLFRRAAVLIS